MRDKAIGVLRLGISGTDRERDEKVIHELAGQRDYELACILVIDQDMPTLQLVETVVRMGARAVLTPDFAHLRGTEKAVTEVADLISPTRILPYSGYPEPRAR